MMLKFISLITLVLIGTTYASYPHNLPVKYRQHLHFGIPGPAVELDLCPDCVQEAVGIINTLLNIVLDEGIVQSCGLLCGALANRTGSVIIGDLCDVACEGVGIDEFVHLLIKLDLDPIYYCQLVKACPVDDNGDGKFTDFQVTPKSAPDGSTFVIDCSFKTANGTGPGTFDITITNPKNESTVEQYWFEARKPGNYTEKIGLRTLVELRTGSILGTYKVIGQLCNGECNAKHPHTSTYDVAKSSFELTKKQMFF